jgi:hypothetical protein
MLSTSRMGIVAPSHSTVRLVKSNFIPSPWRMSRPIIISCAPKLPLEMLISHSITRSRWNLGSTKVHRLFLVVVKLPLGVVQTVLVSRFGFNRSLLACLPAKMLPEAPESSKHFSVIGFAFPKWGLNLMYAKGLTSWYFGYFFNCARSPHVHNSTVLKLRRILQHKLQFFNIPTSIIIALQAYYSPLQAPLSDPLREGSERLQYRLSTHSCRFATANRRADDRDCRSSIPSFHFAPLTPLPPTASSQTCYRSGTHSNPILFEYSNVPRRSQFHDDAIVDSCC